MPRAAEGEIVAAPVNKRGRPRDTAKDIAIREAAWEILGMRGYDGLTFEAVADLAGCGRPTLYRRFKSKLDLVAVILRETADAVVPRVSPQASVREILIAYASSSNSYLAGKRRQAMLSLIECAVRTPALARVMDQYMAQQEKLFLRQFRRAAPQRLSPEFMDFVFDTLAGSVTYHVAVRGRTLDERRLGLLVDQTLALLKKGW